MTEHWPFVVAAYAAAGAIILALTLWVANDYRAVTRRLAELEAQGVRRRGPHAP